MWGAALYLQDVHRADGVRLSRRHEHEQLLVFAVGEVLLDDVVPHLVVKLRLDFHAGRIFVLGPPLPRPALPATPQTAIAARCRPPWLLASARWA